MQLYIISKTPLHKSEPRANSTLKKPCHHGIQVQSKDH